MLYQIEVKGHLGKRWEAVFPCFSIDLHEDGEGQPVSMMIGSVADQSELYGILHKIQNFGIELISIQASDVGYESNSEKDIGSQQGVE